MFSTPENLLVKIILLNRNMFWENVVEYPRHSRKPLILCSTLENFLIGFHFLRKNVFWGCGVKMLVVVYYSEKVKHARVFQTFAIVFSTLENSTTRNWKLTSNARFQTSGALGMKMKKKTLLKLKHVFEKMQWSISETVNARAFKSLPLCSAPLKTY